MKLKLISLLTNTLIIVGTYLFKLSRFLVEKGFWIHIKYKTKIGKKFEIVQQDMIDHYCDMNCPGSRDINDTTDEYDSCIVKPSSKLPPKKPSQNN
jgi:uncharacterized protein YutD